MILDLENTKTTQALKIDSLKRRVKRLEKKQMSRTHKLKRLYKGRIIDDIDANEGITLVDETIENQGRTCEEIVKERSMMLNEELAFKLQVEEEEEEERHAREKAQQIKEVNIAWDDIQAKIDDDYQLAQRLQAK
nr:hypothetical protein [Tanacetum cinerariifolium]